MKTVIKRILSLMLVLALVGSMLPAVYAQDEHTHAEESTVLTDEDYAIVNDVFAQIDAMEDAPAKKNATRTQVTDAAAQIVMASENYVEGSLERNGNSFTWWTDEGIRCIYNPYMREKYSNMKAPAEAEPDGIYNAPKATKGGWPSGNQVYLIAPYYGIDDTFTDQYKNEATSIASAIGDTDGYTLYSGTSVTVDSVADAIENGAVVIFDSHGTTDYDGSYVCDDPDGYAVYDYVSQANYSYLCLTNKSGLTTEDYNAGATYFTDADGYMCACINGAAIANHMEKNSPSGLLWMAICLGMATDTMCQPMREKGVEVVYGYSQSVTFAGDYCFEETFWDNMIAGKSVATSIAAMKSKWGNWDWSEPIAAHYGYTGTGYTLAQARQYRSAFPIVVSDEDTHPGQRGTGTNYGACSEQTVKSTYTLYSQYSVTAQSNSTVYGTVSVNGSTITATPATGYFAQGYTVLSGSATVTQNGNTFTVSAESDCVIQINFAAKTAVSVSFSGATGVAAQTGYAGDVMTLPTATAPEGYTFLGWMTTPLGEDVTEKPEFYTTSFTPTAATTLYALYSYVEEGSGTGTGNYVKVTSTPDDWSGEYVIVYEDAGFIFDGSLESFDKTSNYQEVTITNNTISADEADPYKFTIAKCTGGYSIRGISGYYIGNASNSNALTTDSNALVNTINMVADGSVNIIGNGGAYLRFNNTSGQYRFRYYKSSSYSSQKPIALYLKDGSAGTTLYTGNPVKCEHTNTTQIEAVAATCTESGFNAGVQCVDCESFISGHETVDPLGHSWGDWTETTAPTCTVAGVQTHTCAACGESETQSVEATGHDYTSVVTPPTATEQGYTTYTCSVCGDSYVSDYVEALGEIFTVSFSVPTGVSAVADMECGKNGITLPEAGVPTGDYEYQFVGWSESTVTDADSAPAYYKAGETYTAKQNVTLYALYSYSAEGGTGEWTLVTDEAVLSAGDQIVIAQNAKGFVAGDITSQYMSNVTASFSADKNTVTLSDDAVVMTLGGSADAWTLANSDGKLLGATAVKKLAWGSGNTTWSISVSDGDATIQNNTDAYGRFLYNVGSPRFTTYTSDASSSMLMPQIYAMSGSVTYTTQINTCEHINTTEVAEQPATCTEEGLTAGVYCEDCQKVISGQEIIPATGHSYAGVVTPPTATEQGYTTYTCAACGNSYVGDYTDALGQVYTVSFVTPSGVDAVEAMECGKNGITLPEAGVPSGEVEYVFAGWAEQRVADSETAPTIYTDTYTATQDTTLYAVYTYSVGGSGATEYVLKDISEITATDTVVVTENYNGTVYALTNNYGSGSAPAAITITVEGDKLADEPAESIQWNIGGSSGAYIFYPNGTTATWLYCTNTNNGVRVGTNTSNTFSIDAATGYLKHNGTGRYLGVFRTNPDWRCYTNTTGNTANQTLGFYVKTQAGTTYYTTEFAEPTVSSGGKLYMTVQEAIDNGNGVVTLTADIVEEQIVISGDVYLNLNGCELSGNISGTGTLYGFDTATDAYSSDAMGRITGTVSCNVAGNFKGSTDNIGAIKRYMAIADGLGYTFHRFYLGVTHASLKPQNNGVGYKAVFAGDEMVKAQLATYGYSLQLDGFGAKAVTKSAESFTSMQMVALRIENFDVESFGETDLIAKVTMELHDGTVIESEACTTTLKSMAQSVNENAADYTSEQLSALKEMLAAVIEKWNLTNI